jgi:hypothetical protein
MAQAPDNPRVRSVGAAGVASGGWVWAVSRMAGLQQVVAARSDQDGSDEGGFADLKVPGPQREHKGIDVALAHQKITE